MSIRLSVEQTSWDTDHWSSLTSGGEGGEVQCAERGRNFIQSGTKAPVTLALFVFVICVLKKKSRIFFFLTFDFYLASYCSYSLLRALVVLMVFVENIKKMNLRNKNGKYKKIIFRTTIRERNLISFLTLHF